MSSADPSFQALLDTSAYYALIDTAENTHRKAQEIQHRLIAERWRLITTNFILAETHALVLSRLGYHTALRILQDIDTSSTAIVRITLADEREARELLVKYDDKRFSLTDALSFAVMERLSISHAFTFDRNFMQYGLRSLTAE